MTITLTEHEYNALIHAKQLAEASVRLDREKYFDELTSFLSTELSIHVRRGDMFGVSSNYVRLSNLLEVFSKARKEFVEVGESPVK